MKRILTVLLGAVFLLGPAAAPAGATTTPTLAQLIGQKLMAPCGFEEEMLPNHHLSKPVLIGEIQADGQINTVWKTPGVVKAENWSPFIPENANRAKK